MDNKIDQRKHELATKEDLSSVKGDVNNLRKEFHELREKFHELREEFHDLREEVNKFRIEVKDDINHLRAELLRTIYLTSLGQLMAVIASVVSLVLILRK